ncbi:MAG: hypothetical protein OEV40_04795 [Acidimicrobiia bacterium]|nr:hypothetical protein [Acidimicrobiia bacterium]
MLTDPVLSPHPSRADATARAWAQLTTAGPTLNSAERLNVIATARRAWDGTSETAHGTVLEEAAYWLAKDAGGLRQEIVDEFERRGLDRFRYLETVGVVARLANVDFYTRGLGGPLLALPDPDGTSPTGEVHPDAAITDGWVPATGPLFAPASLDALPAEGEALRDLHEPMYMPMAEMGDPGFVDVLTRAQIEFVAARTSFLNECFY